MSSVTSEERKCFLKTTAPAAQENNVEYRTRTALAIGRALKREHKQNQNPANDAPAESSRRKEWVDFVKGIAITAVVVNHTYGKLYNNVYYLYLSLFSVSVLILMSGYNLANSYRKKAFHGCPLQDVLRRMLRFLAAYLIAVVISSGFLTGRLDLSSVWSSALTFQQWGPYYFIPLYIQMLVFAPFLYKMIERGRKRPYLIFIFAIGVYILSGLSYQLTTAVRSYGGAEYIGGGSYLLLLYLGMLFSEAEVLAKRKIPPPTHTSGGSKERSALRVSIAGMLVSGVLWGGFVYKWSRMGFQNFPAEKGFWFAGEGNPPSATLVCYSLLTLFLMYFGYQVLESCAGLEYRVLNRCAAAVQLILSPVRFWGRQVWTSFSIICLRSGSMISGSRHCSPSFYGVTGLA